ncbi:MAG TPA: hypothetical protein VE198_21895 [Actinoallomurus sp.]|nr:hypothetical protein [Actinoallomurus sp.]
MTADTIEARVARGAALLDEKLPGWDQRIDLGRLNLQSECNCILGQEFADRSTSPYMAAVFELGLGNWSASEHGFDLLGEEESRITERESTYAALTAEWRTVILARRGGAA